MHPPPLNPTEVADLLRRRGGRIVVTEIAGAYRVEHHAAGRVQVVSTFWTRVGAETYRLLTLDAAGVTP